MRNHIFYLYVFFSMILLFGFLSGKPIFAHEWFYVKWINDGDTIVLADGRHVRYIGINAPEIDHKNKKAEFFGYIAKEHNKTLVLSKMVHLEFDKETHDRYGRIMAYVFLGNGVFVNYDQTLLQSQRTKYFGGDGGFSTWAILFLCLFPLKFFVRFGRELHHNVKIPW